MKSQPNHAMIQTPTLARRLDSLVPTNAVYSKDGSIAHVVSNTKLGVKPVYKFYLSDDSSFECNDDTDLTVYISNHLVTMSAINVMKEHKAGKPIRFGLAKPVERMEKDLRIPTDIMGILLHTNTKMVYTDKEVFLIISTQQLQRIMDYFDDCVSSYFAGDAKHHTITSETLINHLKYYNVAKSPEYRVIPDMYLRGSNQQREELLTSLLTHSQFINSYPQMVSSIRELSEGLGYSVSTKYVRGEYTGYWVIHVSTNTRTLVKCEFVYNAYSSELVTSSKDGLYLTNHHIII